MFVKHFKFESQFLPSYYAIFPREQVSIFVYRLQIDFINSCEDLCVNYVE